MSRITSARQSEMHDFPARSPASMFRGPKAGGEAGPIGRLVTS
jgi:hypothetical protein